MDFATREREQRKPRPPSRSPCPSLSPKKRKRPPPPFLLLLLLLLKTDNPLHRQQEPPLRAMSD
jgi:hypothetical protein